MKLARRERYLLGAASGMILLFALFHFVIAPLFSGMERLKKGISAMEGSVREMKALAVQYRRVTESARVREEMLKRRPGGFTLFSFLEKAAGESGIKDRIKYMRPSVQGSGGLKESMVEMQLEDVNLKQLADYLQKIEYADGLIRIKRISVKEAKKEAGYLDALLQVVSVEQ
jgi:type II secretory pathway component PulM